ncbi:VOC family protein [Mesorhizobium sp. M7A.F.Ca.US.010.02.1.1]|uniref:VOC family protein n=1 Tax=Mesorhizobium sp. M7A.F.Ca.US.010.02.1.1 TaxID=2496743 RepID=UPI001FE1D725|nr:VOC family protein [Mesorhizobium sp. M7A.F.Ca.US.010.02.1.1]
MTDPTLQAKPPAKTLDTSPPSMNLELVVIPVSDVDRALTFYKNLGWRLDIDHGKGDDYRIVQLTPVGSGGSVMFGQNITTAAPGSAQGMHLVVPDILAARDDLVRRGVKVSDLSTTSAESSITLTARELPRGRIPIGRAMPLI